MDAMSQAISVQAFRRPEPDVETQLARVRRLAQLLDSEFSIGGFKFGLDAIVGLVPVVGDSVALLVSLYPIFVAQQLGIPFFTRARMLFNVLLDWLIGLVPVIGDLFDAGFKANLKN